jgi:beta-lactamase class A
MVDRYRNYQPQRPAPRQRSKSHRGLYLLVVILLIFGGKTMLGKVRSEKKPETKTSSIPKPKTVVKAEPIPSTTWSDLNQKVTALINQYPNLNIAVSVIDINSNTKANYGIQESFHGASTTKVLTAAAYLHDVEQGKRTLSENLGGGSAESHLRRMINQSDNNSWAVLNSAVGFTRLDTYAHANGINSFKYIGNLMTASDQALLLSKLFKHELLGEANTKLLLSFMQNTNNEDMIPAVKPEGSILYHKYGQLDDRLHDSAIINYKNRPIVLVIYTKGGVGDGSGYAARIKLIQALASTVTTTIYTENQ